MAVKSTDNLQQVTRPIFLFVVGDDIYFLSHRLPAAYAAQKAGFEVVVMASDSGVAWKINKMGFCFVPVKNGRHENGFFNLLLQIIEMRRSLKKIAPDIIQFVGLRTVILGNFSAIYNRKIQIINSINGLGFIFSHRSVKAYFFKFTLILLLQIFSRILPATYLFQNESDKIIFKNFKIFWKQSFIIPGSGVDTDFFKPISLPINNRYTTIGMACRMLEIKGVFDIVEAMKILSERGVMVKLLLAGNIDKGNPTSLTNRDMENISKFPNIKILGYVDNMRDFWAECHLAVLPSHGGEGVPMALIQPAAMGRALIASDTSGNSDICKHGENGLLVAPRSPLFLADAIEKLVKDKKLLAKMGKASIKRVKDGEFSSLDISDKLFSVYYNFNNSHWKH